MMMLAQAADRAGKSNYAEQVRRVAIIGSSFIVGESGEKKNKKFLIQVDLRIVKNLVVEAELVEEAIDAAATISVETLALGESGVDGVTVLGDDPVDNGKGSVQLLAEEGTPEWELNFPEEE
jgi:hypothetical protein